MKMNVTIPVFNEVRRLSDSVEKLILFLNANCRYTWEIVIANNASTDRTWQIARQLEQADSSVHVVHLDQKGRGRALRKVWNESDADILSYMDVDLSTDLKAFPSLIEALVTGGFDLAIGSRLLEHSETTRGFKREVLSRSYNLLIKAALRTHFSDAQCGFKAITRDAAKKLLPLVEDNAWFFDTELLVLAEKLGYRIHDLPVHWVDDTDSRVRILNTAFEDLKGLIRLRRKFAKGDYEGHLVDRLPASRLRTRSGNLCL